MIVLTMMSRRTEAVCIVCCACLVTARAAADVTEIKIGLILISDTNLVYDYHHTAPGVDMAIERVNNDILNASYRIVLEKRWYGPACDGATAPGRSYNI